MKELHRPQDSVSTVLPFARGRTALVLLGLLGVTLAFFSPPARADDGFDDVDYSKVLAERDKGVGWNMAFGLTGGYTDVLTGYKDYTNLGNIGVDTYFRPPVPQFPKWYNRLVFRFSADYFPLQVPETIPYTKEDLFTLSATIVIRAMKFSGAPEHTLWIPFIAVGPAVGWDRITVNHPAVQASGSFLHLGYSASGGIMLPTLGGFRLIPEVRYQSMKEPDQYWTSHISYMMAITYWPPANVEE
ncbi:MAG: hypothetical protein IPP35_11080 [Elusimicrobia bacterium]|nr:hypothetical protein [Elusimicrobiota bacterium]